MEDIITFDSNFMKEGLALLREIGVPDDIARVYIRLAGQFLCRFVVNAHQLQRHQRSRDPTGTWLSGWILAVDYVGY